MAHVITLSNIKGGAGKSTSAIFIADGLAAMGYKVLLIDLDAQINTTYAICENSARDLREQSMKYFESLIAKKSVK